VIFWPVIFVLVTSSILFAQEFAGQNLGPVASLERVFSEEHLAILSFPRPTHLWFLMYLLVFYALTLPVLWQAARRRFGMAVFLSVSAPLFAVAVVAATYMPGPNITTPAYFRIDPATLAFYFAFFLIGVFAFSTKAFVPLLGRYWAAFVVLGAISLAALSWIQFGDPGIASASGIMPDKTAVQVATAVASLAMALALTAVFVRFLNIEHPVVSYLAKASYWTYIVHVPFTFLVAAAMSRLGLPAAFSLFFVIAFVTIICLLSFELLVRRTPLARILA